MILFHVHPTVLIKLLLLVIVRFTALYLAELCREARISQMVFHYEERFDKRKDLCASVAFA